MNDKTFMTVQERNKFYENSKAFSPENAASKVASIAQTALSALLTKNEKSRGIFSDDTLKYCDYCASLKTKAERKLSRKSKSPYKSAFGNSNADKILSLSLALATLISRFKTYEEIPANNMMMTLGDFLDALIDLSITEDGTADTARIEQYRNLKKEFSEYCDLSTPLRKAVADILKQYSEPRAAIGRAAHIISCDFQVKYRIQEEEMREEFLDSYDEDDYYEDDHEQPVYDEVIEENGDNNDDNETEVSESPCEVTETEPPVINHTEEFEPEEYDTRYEPYDPEELAEIRAKEYFIEMYPFEYYLELAKEPLEIEKIDFDKGGYSLGSLTNFFHLPSENYSPETAKAEADQAELYPKFRELIDETVTEESFSGAFRQIDDAVGKLYRLLVEPFAELGKYHFERHIA